MRKGLLDVLPKNALEDLTAEDFRLLVNGCGEVNVQMLISFTSFNDESGMLLSLDLSPSYLCINSDKTDLLSYMFFCDIVSKDLFFIQQGKMQKSYCSLNAGFGP